MSANDDLKEQLRRWGFRTVNRYARTWDGASNGDSVLALAKDMAPGTRENAARRLAPRDGGERRRFMAEKLCAAEDAKLSMRTVPMWAVDPVRASNDASRGHDNHAVVDLGIPDDLRWIERAVCSLSRQSPVRALVLREEFCGTGTQRMKAGRVERQYGGRLSVRQYRYELALALEWIRMKSAA